MPKLKRSSLGSVINTSLVALFVTGLMLSGLVNDAAAGWKKTVTISGKAYRFNHMDTPLPGATIKVREYRRLKAVTDQNGDYRLEVPNHRNVTPYIVAGTIPPGDSSLHQHYNEIDLQTFRPRGRDIENANFQSPTDLEYEGLKAMLAVPADENGRPEQCVIVTTSSARNVRGVDYQAFWDRTPHGVAGATARAVPSIAGPTYFNEEVLPDESRTFSSEDGGIIWKVVPTGSYRIIGKHPTTRFTSFLATCKPGRIVNANPPWGMYELGPGEQRPLAASNAAARVIRVKAYRKPGRKRFVAIKVKSGEQITLDSILQAPGFIAAGTSGRKMGPGTHVVRYRIPARSRVSGRTSLYIALTDASGVGYPADRKVVVPKVKKAGRRAAKRRAAKRRAARKKARKKANRVGK